MQSPLWNILNDWLATTGKKENCKNIINQEITSAFKGRSRRFWSEYENLLTILSTHVVSMIRKRIPGTVTGSQENPLEPLFNPLLISATLTFKIYYVTIKILLNWLLLHIPTLFRRNWWKKSTHYRGVSCSQVIHWS